MLRIKLFPSQVIILHVKFSFRSVKPWYQSTDYFKAPVSQQHDGLGWVGSFYVEFVYDEDIYCESDQLCWIVGVWLASLFFSIEPIWTFLLSLQIDTLAAEYPAMTNYLYCTYHGQVWRINNKVPFFYVHYLDDINVSLKIQLAKKQFKLVHLLVKLLVIFFFF